MQTPEMIQQLVDGRATIEVTRTVKPGQAMALITTDDGVKHEVRITLQKPRGHHQATIATYRTKAVWEVEELRELGLPLYWSRAWLLEELTIRRSAQEIELISGYPAPLLRRWKDRHRIMGNPRHDMIRREYLEGRFESPQQAADHYGISRVTLEKILNTTAEVGPNDRRRTPRV